MKKIRLLTTLLVMLLAVSAYSQDSYRQAVKDFMAATDQVEHAKSLISTISIVYDRSGEVDIDQLTKRYIDEYLEDALLDVTVPLWKAKGITEAEMREMTSLYSSPEYKAYSSHQKDWMLEFANYVMEPLFEAMEIVSEGVYRTPKSLDRLHSQLQPNAEIDTAYINKFNQVMMESVLVKSLKDAMFKKMDERMEQAKGKVDMDESKRKESGEDAKEWMAKNLPVILLNSAYGKLSIEDLDYAAMLFSNETYNKLNSYTDEESMNKVSQNLNYGEWMKEHGAKYSDDPNSALEFFKSLLGGDDKGFGK